MRSSSAAPGGAAALTLGLAAGVAGHRPRHPARARGRAAGLVMGAVLQLGVGFTLPRLQSELDLQRSLRG